MLTPDAQAQIDAHEARRAGWLHGTRPLYDSRLGARTIGDMALVEPGCQVYALSDGSTDQRLRVDGEARGGIVLETVDLPIVDDETGERWLVRAFRTLDPEQAPDTPATVLAEPQVDRERFEPPNPRTIRGVMRRKARWLGVQTGAPTRRELDVAGDVGRLAAILALHDAVR